jgi:hypothetical protein
MKKPADPTGLAKWLNAKAHGRADYEPLLRDTTAPLGRTKQQLPVAGAGAAADLPKEAAAYRSSPVADLLRGALIDFDVPPPHGVNVVPLRGKAI